MTFPARRTTVALAEAAVASLGVLSQLLPGTSRLVVVVLPLAVLVLASAGQLIDREQPRAPQATPMFAVITSPDWSLLGTPDSVGDADAREDGPIGWPEIALPFSVGAAAYCPLERRWPSRPAVVQPGLFPLEVIDGDRTVVRCLSAA